MENLTSKVSEKLKSVGKSKSELAAHLNVSEYGLTKMLKRGTLKSDTMAKMVKFLNVDLSFFGMNNTGGKGDSISMSDESSLETKVEYLERVIATKDEVIRAKDEVIKAKDAEIATLKLKIK